MKPPSINRLPIIKYAVSGISNTVTDFIIFSILYYILTTHVILANSVAFFVAFVQSYYINKNWTFSHTNTSTNKKTVISFFVVSLGGLMISNSLIYFLSSHIEAILAKLIATIIVFIYGYTLNKLFVFR